jgi:hypothetical protein
MGAANVSDNGIVATLISPITKQYPIAIELKFECTINIA